MSKLAKDALTDTRNIPKTLSRTCPNAVQAVSAFGATDLFIILKKEGSHGDRYGAFF